VASESRSDVTRVAKTCVHKSLSRNWRGRNASVRCCLFVCSISTHATSRRTVKPGYFCHESEELLSLSRFATMRTTVAHFIPVNCTWPIPVAARSKAYVCGRALAGIVGSNPTAGMDVCLVQCLCCQVEVSATGRSLVQRSPTDCDVCVYECDQVKSQNPRHQR
jgi:hypothetical protein